MSAAHRLVALCLAAALLERSASADEIHVDKKKEAARLFKAGVEMVDRREDPEKLIETFSQSYALDPEPGALLNLALAEAMSKKHREVDALKNLRFWLAKPNRDPVDIAHAQKAVEKLLTRVGHIKVTGATHTVVAIDGAEEALIQDVYDVRPGKHHVEVSNGSARSAQEVDVVATKTVEITLTPPPVLPVPPAVAPSEPALVPVGPPPTVAETRPMVEPRSAEPMHHERSSLLRIGVTTGLGVASAAAIVVGAVLEANAKTNLDAASSLVAPSVAPSSACSTAHASSLCASAASHWQTHETEIHVAPWVFVGAGVFVAAGIVSWKLIPPQPSKERAADTAASLTPIIAPGYVGATVVGHF